MYSSVTQLRNNLILVDETRLTGDAVMDRIQHADDDIMMDLSKYVDFSNGIISEGYSDPVSGTPTTPLFPIFLNHLSQYKTCEHCLVKMYGAKRTADQISDIQYWQVEYKKLLERIKTNEVPVTLTDGTYVGKGQFKIHVGKQYIAPALGEGKYGQWIPDDDLAHDRPRQPGTGTTIYQ